MKMKISDFMDLQKLQNIQDQFSDATGLAAIATDAEGNYITEGSNFTDFCMKHTRNSEEGLKRCVKCDTECKGTYFCHAGLMDFASDIVVNGEKVGAIIGGQVLPAEPDEEEFRRIAEELSIDPGEYIAALRQVPIRSEKSIRAAAAMLSDVINQVVNLAYIKYMNDKKIGRFEVELEDATKVVDVINQKTEELAKIASKQNILALNASIESARAGSAGAGFSVIAKQMGELANQSASIHQEISDAAKMIKDSVAEMNRNNENKTI